MARTERSGHTTTDHDFIRQWVEERGGWPARVAGTESGGDDAGLIRVDFPGYSGAGSLERIEWEEWFQKFDESELAFLHRDMTHGGNDLDRFNKLVKRSADDNDNESRTTRGRSTRTSGGARSSSSGSSSRGASSSRTSGGASSSGGGGGKRAAGSRSSESSSGSTRGGGSKSGSTSSTRSASKSGGTSSSRSSGGSSRSTTSKSGGSSSGGSSSSRPAASRSASANGSSRSSSGRSAASRSSSGNGASRSSSGKGSGAGGGARSTTRRVAAAVRDTLLGGNGNGGGPGGEMRELLKHELGDLLFAEKVFLKATKTLAKEAQDPAIKGRVEEHVRETEGHIERLNQAFRAIGEKPKAEKCEAALGLQAEHDSFKSDEKPSKTLLSAFDLGSGLRVEHYEIAAYRTAIAVATAVGERECAGILKENLKEEMAMASFLEKSALGVLKGMARA
jgi:ferritin-like metal-binding protein YciE